MVAGVAGDAGIVDQNVEPSPLARRFGERLAALLGGNIANDKAGLRAMCLTGRDGFFCVFNRARAVDNDIGSARREPRGNALAKPRG